MTAPNVNLNLSDPVARALFAEHVAQDAFDSAGYYRNILEMKSKKGDLEAKKELPEAQRQVEIAQQKLKRSQTYLALITGAANNPHARKRVAPTPLKKSVETDSTQIASNETVSPQPIKKESFIRGEFIQRAAFVEITVIHSLHRKDLMEKLQKLLKDKSPADIRKMLINPPQNGEMIHILKIPQGEMATRQTLPLLASAMEYLKKSE
jgi:hypothetical protein